MKPFKKANFSFSLGTETSRWSSEEKQRQQQFKCSEKSKSNCWKIHWQTLKGNSEDSCSIDSCLGRCTTRMATSMKASFLILSLTAGENWPIQKIKTLTKDFLRKEPRMGSDKSSAEINSAFSITKKGRNGRQSKRGNNQSRSGTI